ncbi:hypothetical protein BGZ99_003289 [Dissophora globulifera]|uniref:Uncharacterized protein n=1 Tax=Dissophora globulifera TaxID=979702 RepID=A0A9P6RTC7_9FUNG|nr:hypothetical protein BGZ99_003289 [Dissophora globulifera]
MGYTFDIELDTDQPFIIELDLAESKAQTISGAIVVDLDRADSFKIATIAVHGHIGAMMNIGTPAQELIRETLVDWSTDLIAANDTDGSGTIHLEAGKNSIPFRLDLPQPDELPPTLINKLDTPYIDWKYEIHATLRRQFFLSKTRVVKHDLILRRPIAPTVDSVLTTSMDHRGQYRSKLTVPGQLVLGQDRVAAQAELKARSKEFMIKEVECTILQTEEIDYTTKMGHDNVVNAHAPGAHCTVSSTRLVSSVAVFQNDENDMDFGHHNPIEFNIRVDNDQLIPTEHGLGWLKISHMLRYNIKFMNVELPLLTTELPLFVGNEVISKTSEAAIRPQSTSSRLMSLLKIDGTEGHFHHHHAHEDRDSTPEPEQ